jgi:hypothetical protein
MSDGFNSKQWSVNRANFDRNLAVVIGIDRYENDSIQNRAENRAVYGA